MPTKSGNAGNHEKRLVSLKFKEIWKAIWKNHGNSKFLFFVLRERLITF